jgi:hypothetical protein
MKRYKKEKPFLECLTKTCNKSLCCEKIGISRQSVYRWEAKDPRFRYEVEEALQMGTDHICDIAENTLVKKAREGNIQAAKIILENNKKAYRKPREQTPPEFMKPRRIETVVFMQHGDPDPTEEQIQAQIEKQNKEKQNENPDVLE